MFFTRLDYSRNEMFVVGCHESDTHMRMYESTSATSSERILEWFTCRSTSRTCNPPSKILAAVMSVGIVNCSCCVCAHETHKRLHSAFCFSLTELATIGARRSTSSCRSQVVVDAHLCCTVSISLALIAPLRGPRQESRVDGFKPS